MIISRHTTALYHSPRITAETGSDSVKQSHQMMKWLSIPIRTYLHELGHSVAFSLIYTNARPTISLRALGFFGGSCQPNFNGIPRFSLAGKYLESLGRGTSISVAAGAGPLVDVISLLALSVFSKKSPMISFSQNLKSHSLLVYALSALLWDKSNCQGHDFCEIWARSGFLTYSAALATCIACYLYVNKQLHPSFKKAQGLEQTLLSLAFGCIETIGQFQLHRFMTQ